MKKLVFLADLAGIVTAVAVMAAMFVSGSAGAAAGAHVLRFHDRVGRQTAIRFGPGSATLPAGDSSVVLTLALFNQGAQFGKPTGAQVGRVVLNCTFLRSTTDKLCTGIAHVPDGYFLFSGNDPSNAKVSHYMLTGGVGPYASNPGQVKVTNLANGSSSLLVTLTS